MSWLFSINITFLTELGAFAVGGNAGHLNMEVRRHGGRNGRAKNSGFSGTRVAVKYNVPAGKINEKAKTRRRDFQCRFLVLSSRFPVLPLSAVSL